MASCALQDSISGALINIFWKVIGSEWASALIDQAARALAQGQGFEGVQPANELVKEWGELMAGELLGLGFSAVLGSVRNVFERRPGKAKTGEEAEFTGCK